MTKCHAESVLWLLKGESQLFSLLSIISVRQHSQWVHDRLSGSVIVKEAEGTGIDSGPQRPKLSAPRKFIYPRGKEVRE